MTVEEIYEAMKKTSLKLEITRRDDDTSFDGIFIALTQRVEGPHKRGYITYRVKKVYVGKPVEFSSIEIFPADYSDKTTGKKMPLGKIHYAGFANADDFAREVEASVKTLL